MESPLHTPAPRDDECLVADGRVILCVVWRGGALGAAYYEVDSARLYLLRDVAEGDSLEYLRAVLLQARPTTILTSSKQTEKFLDVLRAASADGAADGEFLQVLPSTDFNVDACRVRLTSIHLPHLPAGLSGPERELAVAATIDLQSANMVRACGALHKYLERRRIGIELEDSGAVVPIARVVSVSLDDYVMVDEDAFRSLQIFSREIHAASCKLDASSKEGLSLFALLNKTKSSPGEHLLRSWFFRPLRSVEAIAERHDAIACCLDPRHADNVDGIRRALSGVRNVPGILNRMRRSKGTVADWKGLQRTILSACAVKELCRALPPVGVFGKIARAFSQDLNVMASLLARVFDQAESANQGRFVVMPGIDDDLDEMKRVYNGLPDFMTKVAREEMASSAHVDECNVVYFPQIGYLVAVPRKASQQCEADFHIPGYEFQFVTKNAVHYKSVRTREMDRVLGDIHGDIIDRETEIALTVQSKILAVAGVLEVAGELLAELDCIASLATVARDFNYVRPAVGGNSIDIVVGRHPLQELGVGTFIPNDFHAARGADRMHIVTGPNASGKSIYIKQVALIVYMAHIGSFVPAESATVAICDRVFTRIQSRESVSLAQSTFMIDAVQVSAALCCATARSLVVIDEFGKGTGSADGVALLAATIRHLAERPGGAVDCPVCLVSTHFHELLAEGLLPSAGAVLKLSHMAVVREAAEVAFLYHVADGFSSDAFGCRVAAVAGLPQDIVDRGRRVSVQLSSNATIEPFITRAMRHSFDACAAIAESFFAFDLDHAPLSELFGAVERLARPQNSPVQ